MSKSKDKGLIAGAPPTAPGGMSQKALAAELVEKHGYDSTGIIGLTWPEMIDAVIQGRLDREAEAASVRNDLDIMADETGPVVGIDYDGVDEHSFGGLDNEEFAEVWFDSADYEEDLDPETLMGELTGGDGDEPDHEGLLIKSPDTLDYIFNGHAGAGPSASERWLSCTASLGASREFLETLTPNQQATFANSNAAARQGTTAHAAAEVEARVILGEMDSEEAALSLIELAAEPEDGEHYDTEMAEYITEYTDLVKSYAQERGNESILIEHRVSAAVPLTGLHEGEVYEIQGSADFIALPTEDAGQQSLVIGDLKYGSGMWVGVDENSQAMIYALGALGAVAQVETGELPKWLTEVVLHIIQPRMDGIKTATLTVEELLDWRDEVLAPNLTKALYGTGEGATFVPSEGACQFCPARGACAALAESRVAAASELFDVVIDAEREGETFPETSALSDARLGELYTQIEGLISIHKDLKAEAERRLYRGGSVPGLQLVNYTPPRKWKEGAEQKFEGEEVMWVKKLITPTQALKIAQANPEEWDEDELTPLIEAPDKKPVVAKVGDRRKTWEGKPPESMFADESSTEED